MVAKTQILSLSPLYRVWQFVQALSARPLSPAERRQISVHLTPDQLALFDRMGTHDQRHSLQVLRTLLEDGQAQPDLLAAALLHDVGKARYPLRLWERPLVVLTRSFRPQIVRRWGREPAPRGWKRPFIIYEQHPVWGAEMAAAANCSPLAVELIRRHHEPAGDSIDDRLLADLQAADNAN